MEYGGITRDEMEVTIRLDRATRQAHIYSTWPEWSRKLERRYGPPKRITTREGKAASAFWTIPNRMVSLRQGARTLTAAQREAAATRLRRAREMRSERSSSL